MLNTATGRIDTGVTSRVGGPKDLVRNDGLISTHGDRFVGKTGMDASLVQNPTGRIAVTSDILEARSPVRVPLR